MANDILGLVASYVNAVRGAVDALQSHLQTSALLSAVHKDRQLQRGSLDATTTYAFHGVGCRVRWAERTVEFDFGPDGRVGGFDAWRLCLFAEEGPGGSGAWDREAVETGLQELLVQGLVELPGSEPSPHLYYLTRKGEAAILGALHV